MRRQSSAPILLALVLLLPAACTNPTQGWHEPRDPASLGEATLSAFESGTTDNGNPSACRWVQVDPVDGARRVLLTMDDECLDPRAVISPDGRSAAVTTQSSDEAPLYEVSLVTGSWRRLPAGPGTIDQLFWREGVLYMVATWEEPASWLTRLGLNAAQAESLAHTFRWDGRSWTRTEEPLPDQVVLDHLDTSAVTTAATTPDLPAPTKKLAHQLEKQFGEASNFRQIAPNAYMEWNDGELEGPVIFLRPDGSLETNDGADQSPITAANIQIRGRWMLVTDAGNNPMLYDISAGTVLYRSQEASNVTFWPRP
jgi:hypothetical protein